MPLCHQAQFSPFSPVIHNMSIIEHRDITALFEIILETNRHQIFQDSGVLWHSFILHKRICQKYSDYNRRMRRVSQNSISQQQCVLSSVNLKLFHNESSESGRTIFWSPSLLVYYSLPKMWSRIIFCCSFHRKMAKSGHGQRFLKHLLLSAQERQRGNI